MQPKMQRQWSLVCNEILHRWPFIQAAKVTDEHLMRSRLALLLCEHLGLSYTRALAEVDSLWADVEERLRRAA